MGASWGRFTALVLAGCTLLSAPAAAPAKKTRLLLMVAMLAGGALIGAAQAAADTTVSQTSGFTYTGTNSCTGEQFMGTGNIHFLMSDNLSTSGAIEHHLDVRIDGLQAFTLVTNKKYVVQDTFDQEFVIAGATEETFNITAHFIRVAEDGTFILGDDFYEYFRTHITANDSGMVTAFDVATNDMPCQ